MRNFTTVHDFLESQEVESPGATAAKEHIGEKGKVHCIKPVTAYDYTRRMQKWAEGDDVSKMCAELLGVAHVRAACNECMNGSCDFRRMKNPSLPETTREEYYVQPEES